MAKAIRHPETRDVWPRALLLFGGGLLVFLAVAVVALRLIFGTVSSWPMPGASSQRNEASPALQPHPEADLAAFRKVEDAELHKLGWVDRKAGIARIPIEDAMQLVASHGLPDWTGAAAPAEDDCRLLAKQVPRASQVGRCGSPPASKEGARPK